MSGFHTWTRTTPDATAIATTSGTQTFGELEARSRSLVGALKGAGLHRGDRIAVLGSNRIEFVEVCVAALRAGIVPVPFNPLLTDREVEYLLEDSGASWLFSERPLDSPVPQRIVTFGDAYERCLHDAEPAELADVALGRPLHYTSGTTGRPRGVWVKPTTETRARDISVWFRTIWGISSEEVHLVCSPLSNSAPMTFLIRSLESGGTVVLQTHFEAAETLAAIELFGATSTFMVPAQLERIVAMGSGVLARHDLSSMRLLTHAGAPIRTETKRVVIDLFPENSVWEFYGATEGQATRISAREWLRKPGSVGTPPPGGSIRIRSSRGDELRAGDTGIVWINEVNGDRFEYWGDPRATEAAWDGDAFTVGDLGYLDDDGYLYLAGRLHDTIITGGVAVLPGEVEAVLAAHPAVAEVAVYGAHHAEWGQEVRAYVVPAAGQPLDPDLLGDWARERLSGFKCPRRIEIVTELPTT